MLLTFNMKSPCRHALFSSIPLWMNMCPPPVTSCSVVRCHLLQENILHPPSPSTLSYFMSSMAPSIILVLLYCQDQAMCYSFTIALSSGVGTGTRWTINKQFITSFFGLNTKCFWNYGHLVIQALWSCVFLGSPIPITFRLD